MSRRWSELLVCVTLLVPAAAQADTPTDVQAHMRNAAEAHKAGDFARARTELEAAYALDPKPALLYALGQVNVKLGNCANAITFYDQYLATNPSPASADAARQAISVCRLAQEQAKREAPVPTEPGETPPTPAVETSPLPPPAPSRRPWYSRPVGLALLGGGVAGIAVGGVLYGSARSTQSDADAATSYERAAQLDSDAHGTRTLSLVVGSAGVALAAAGIVYYVLTSSSESSGVAIVPRADGAIVTWGGSL